MDWSTYYVNPDWIRDAIAARALFRRSLGARRTEYDKFMSLFNVRAESFGGADPYEVPESETVVEVIKKEFINHSEQDEDDNIEIKGHKSSYDATNRNYQLTIGTDRSKQIHIGGSLGLSASFFNLAGPGVSLNACHRDTSGTFTCTDESAERSPRGPVMLGKDYSITNAITIPAKSQLEVTIKRYSVNFQLPGVKVIVSAPASASLQVLLTRTCPWQNRFSFVTAEDYLKNLCGQNAVRRVGTRVEGTQTSLLTYLGEKTQISKKLLRNELLD